MAKRLDVLAAVVLVGVSAGSAAAQEGTKPPNFVLRHDEILEVYPAAAKAKGLEGEAVLACDGTYQHPFYCEVKSEKPAGEGFGDAAVALTRRYLFDPAGHPPSRIVDPISITVPFALPKVRPAMRANGVDYSLPQPLERPSMDALYAAWPRAARFTGVQGSVDLWCTVGLDGRLHACTIRKEQDGGEGFGAAALSVAPLFRYQPALRDGKPAPLSMSVTVRFACDAHCRGFEGPPVVRQRQWLSAPTPEQVQAVYPPAARDHGLEGQARLNCTVVAAGGLEACEILAESAADHGFGAAALQLTPLFRLAARDPAAPPARIALVVAFGAGPATLGWLWGRDEPAPLDAAGKPLQGEGDVRCRVSVPAQLADCAVVGTAPVDPVVRAALAQRAAARLPQIWTADGRSIVGTEVDVRTSLNPAVFTPWHTRKTPPPVIAPGVIDYRPTEQISGPGDFSNYYPNRAMRHEVDGRVETTCERIVGERPDGCRVTWETPPAYGFGEAALKVVGLYRYAPATIDGVAVDERVIIPFEFKVPN